MEPYELIRSRRRTMALEITETARVLVGTHAVTQAEADAFFNRHGDWVARIWSGSAEGGCPAAASYPGGDPGAEGRAQAVLPGKVAYWSQRTGLVPSGVKITTARKRYGSCSGTNGLCFSCFLMNCPEEAVDLVVVHELCHIREKNHGPGFYALLSQYLPDYRERKKLAAIKNHPRGNAAGMVFL